MVRDRLPGSSLRLSALPTAHSPLPPLPSPLGSPRQSDRIRVRSSSCPVEPTGGFLRGVHMSDSMPVSGEGPQKLPAFVPPVTTGTGSDVTPPRLVKKAIGPGLRKLLYVVLALLALLIANSAYLVTITVMEWATGATYQNFFYLCMFLGHLVLGLLLIVPFLVFCAIHIKNTLGRKNRKVVNVGYALFGASLVVLISGLALFQVEGFELKQPQARSIAYWAHVISPLFGVWLYVLHRLAGPRFSGSTVWAMSPP